jgi:pimeloyl-ACP methyl ester carboxylesterase
LVREKPEVRILPAAPFFPESSTPLIGHSKSTSSENLPAPVEIGHVDLGDQQLEFVRYGAVSDEAPSLIFLHEGLGSVAMWRDFPARVAMATGAQAIVYSRSGYGRSSPRTGPYDVDYMHREALDILPRLFDAWGISEPVLVGHSDGASIALIQAAADTSPVSALALVAPHIYVEPVSVQSITEAREHFKTTDLEQRLGRYHDDPTHAFQGWNDIWLHADFLNWNIEALLPSIDCPILAIQGENDAYGTMVQIDSIATGTRGPVELLKLPDCGHSPHRDQPSSTLDALSTFINGLNTP